MSNPVGGLRPRQVGTIAECTCSSKRKKRAPRPQRQKKAKNGHRRKTFKILTVKTTLAVPYASVFLELDWGCGGPED